MISEVCNLLVSREKNSFHNSVKCIGSVLGKNNNNNKNRIEQFRQNRLFKTDQSRLYKELNGEEAVDLAPEKEEAKRFCSDIWSKKVKYNNDAEWLKKIREEQMDRFKQDRIEITIGKVNKVLKGMPNWKSAGPDLV